MKKVYAFSKDRIPLSLSNYMPGCNLGYDKRKEEFINICQKYEKPYHLCVALNRHKWTTEIFVPYQTIANGFIIKAVDPWGNTSYIRVTNGEEN